MIELAAFIISTIVVGYACLGAFCLLVNLWAHIVVLFTGEKL